MDFDDLDLAEGEIDDLPEGEYDKNKRFDQDVLDESLEAAEDQLKENKKEWRKTDIDSLRIDSKEALAYRGESYDKSLVGRYNSKDQAGKKAMMHNMAKPIHDQVVNQINGKDPFNTFFISKGGEIKNKLPGKNKRKSGVDHSDAYSIAKQLGVPTGKSAGATLDRLNQLSSGTNTVNYKKKGKKILGVNMPSDKDIRGSMPEPLTLPPTNTTKYRLKNPSLKTPAKTQFQKTNLSKNYKSKQAATSKPTEKK